MAFSYLAGVLLFIFLYCFGMRICEFFDPYPQLLPPENNYFVPPIICTLIINGKSFDCIKQQYMRKEYNYSADCDIIERVISHTEYTLKKPIDIGDIDKTFLSCEVMENGSLIRCYATDRKTLVPYEPETEERVYSYRKPFRRKKISA